MSVYCISDIHGHKLELSLMLDKISFCENDELYILGDLIDKGPESADLLFWAVEDAPQNVHFLKGNHEDLMYSSIIGNARPTKNQKNDLWYLNDGLKTMEDLQKMVDGKWINYHLLPWIEGLPLFKVVFVRGKKFMLVHGGFNPKQYSHDDNMRFVDSQCDYNTDDYADNRYIRVGHGFGSQSVQEMMWERKTWIEDPQNAPCDVVFGHSYIEKGYLKDLQKTNHIKTAGGSGRIAHIMNKHCIDCGCSQAGYANDFDDKKYNLACLRLDDMKEFYVPCRLGTA